MTDKEMKPCPFCGVKGTLHKSTYPDGEDFVSCMNEYCSCWDNFRLEEWNTRSAPASEELRCIVEGFLKYYKSNLRTPLSLIHRAEQALKGEK